MGLLVLDYDAETAQAPPELSFPELRTIRAQFMPANLPGVTSAAS